MLRRILLSLTTSLFIFTNITTAQAFHGMEGGTISAQADPYSGGAGFGVPIEVPPGRAGIQPNIQLQYSSSLPNGLLGVGWSLELGSIQRSTHKGVPSYTNSNEFVLIQSGGGQELVFDPTAGFYRAKNEGAFMKTEFVNSTYWRVTDKKGTRYYFGEDQSSREHDPANTARVFKWALNRVEDINGNNMTVSYFKADNKLYPNDINYTGNSQTGSLPFAQVLFNYNVNPNQRVSFISGFQVKTTQRLSQINIYGGGTLQGIYKINYAQSTATDRSLIASLVRYAPDQTTALPAQSFVYQSVKPTYSLVQPVPGSVARFAGDFNGDGFSDVALLTSSSGQVDVALSNGSSFGLPQSWISSFGINQNIISGDFNADGRADIGSFDATAGNWKVAYSMGNYFADTGTWMPGFGANAQPSTGDFNGDGRTDLFSFYKSGDNLHVKIAVNKGGYFEALSGFDLYIGTKDDIPLTIDFNGDGLTDLLAFDKASGRWFVYWNEGDLDGKFTLLQTITGFGANYNPVVADFNADNLPDIGYFDPPTGNIVYRVSDEFSFSGNNLAFATGFNIPGPDAQIQSADFNGDGLADFAGHNPQGDKEVRFSSGTPLDLLASIANGVGAMTTITYQPSTKYTNTYLPFSIPVVKSIQNSNGRGDVYQMRYSYAGGYWDKTEREFCGFETVTVTDPQNNYAKMRFLQDPVFKGRPVSEEKYSAGNALFAKTENTWRAQEIAPGVNFVSLYGKNNFVYDGNSSGRRTLEEYFYEETPQQLGNLTRVVQYGEVDLVTGNDISGDDRTIETTYVNNVSGSNWLIGLPRLTTVKNNAGQPVRQSWFYYDNQGNTVTPVKGLLTKKEDWADGGVNPITQYSYDTVGNLLTTTDPKGNVTRITYDTTYKMFPLTTENALTHKVVSEYYGVNGVALSGGGLNGLWGQVKSTTDPNQRQGKRSYDVFGRLVMTIAPLDSVAYPTQTTAIQYFSDYTKVTTSQRVKSGQAQTLNVVSFYDSFDRLIQTKTPSEVAGQYVVSGQAEYDSRGLKIRQYLPYFSTNPVDMIEPINSSGPSSTILYDAMGRPVRTTNADSTYASVVYDDWATTATDENGHQQRSCFDAWGRLIKKEEYTGADGRSQNYPATPSYTLYAATLYSYDSEGNLLQTKDAYNNITTITYDTLGRKTAMTDPDMGHWTYEYDLNGNLTEQIDAKGQTLTFAYDALNRLTNKADGVNGTVSVNYTYDNTSSSNSKGRLTQAAYTGGNTQFAYDELGRELQSIKQMNATNYSVTRGYDALNRLLNIQYPDQKNIYYQYNPAGQIEAISNDVTILPQSFNWTEEKTDELAFKYEIRSTKSETNSNNKNPNDQNTDVLNLNNLNFGFVSDFGFRASNLRTSFSDALAWLEHNVLGVEDAYAQAALPDSFKQESSAYGLVSIEAENYHTKTAPAGDTPKWDRVTTTGQSGAGSMKANPNSGVSNDTTYATAGPRLNYKIKFVKTGTHYIWIRAIGATANDDSVHAGLDGQALTTSDKITNFTTAWTWSKTTADAGAVATINVATAGEHTLNLWMREDGVVIDKIVMTSSSTYTPSGTGPAESPQVAPAAPVLSAPVAGNKQVSLSWSAVTGAAGYKVYRRVSGGTYATSNDVGPARTYIATGLTNATVYYFVVAAYNAAGQSVYSNEVNAMPSAPMIENPTLFIKNVDYGASGQMTRVEYGNGDVTTYTYNPLNLRLTRLYTVDKNGVALQDLNYTYDSAGNILSIADNVNTADQTFQYDALNRLTQAAGQNYGTKTYTYDAIGNIVAKDGKTYFYGGSNGGPHAVTALSDGTTFGYDLNGNMITKVEAGVTTNYAYDPENRLIQVKKGGSIIGQYTYDGDGGRTTKVATVSGQTTTTTFVGSLFETSGARNTKFIFLGDQRIAAVTSSPSIGSTTLYYHADHLGGANVLTDATGFKKELIEYEPFGLESRHEKYGSSEEVAWYYFTGKKTDDESGLIYFGARYYDPSLARFITSDTIVPYPNNPQALNRYSYAGNNPVSHLEDGHGWGKWWKKAWNNFVQAIRHPFDIKGQWNNLVGEANQPGIAPITSAVITVASFMFMQPELFLTSAMWTSTAASAGSAAFLQSPAGQNLTDWTASNIYDNVLGMRPGTARIWASIDLGMTSSYLIERSIANIIADPVKTRSLTNNELKNLSSEGYFTGDENAFGPSLRSKDARFDTIKGLTKDDKLVGSFQKRTLDMPGFKQIGAQHSSANALAVSGPQLNPSRYATWGVCHQATNMTLLQGGISSTILDLGPSFDMFVTTAVYGNYGGQLGSRAFTGANAYRNEERRQ